MLHRKQPVGVVFLAGYSLFHPHCEKNQAIMVFLHNLCTHHGAKSRKGKFSETAGSWARALLSLLHLCSL